MGPKKPAQKMSLGDFLQDSSLGNWADELEDMPVIPSASAGRDQRDRYESRSYDQEGDSRIPRTQLPLPTQPPYTAHVGNLAFDLTENEIENYFQDCKVISVRVMKDKIDNRPKGFGYVEFADLESLKKALSLGDGQLAGRSVRISVAEPPKSGGYGADEASAGEWRSGKVLPPMESRNRMGDREPRMNRNFSSDDSGRPERREMALASTAEGVDKWERRGPLPPSEAPERRSRGGGGFGSRQASANLGTAPSRSPPRDGPAETGEWRSSKAPAPVTGSDGNTPPPTSPSVGGSPIMQRRKLALLPRSDRQQESAQTPPTSATESKPKSNPFGAARPVDTDSALKKVEDKLAKEKEHQDEVTSAGKGAAAASSQPTSPTAPRPEKGRGQPKQLLRRTSANTASVSQSDADEVVAAKPEVQEEVAAGRADSTWRKVDPPSVSAPAATAAPAEEEAGWATVPSRTKKANGVGVKATR